MDLDKKLIAKYIMGGTAIGGSMGLLTSLVNYLNHLKQEKTEDDDDTLYIYEDKPLNKKANASGGVALTGGVVSAAAAYALVNHIYSELRKQEAQRQLDKAQIAFIEAEGYKPLKNKPYINKEAADRPMSFTETLLSLPVALPLLAALGGGVATYQWLNKSFPLKKPEAKGPKKIEIISKPDNDQAEWAKKASVGGSKELCVRLIMLTKEASSDVRNLVHAVASGQRKAFVKLASEIGFGNALNAIKGAWRRPIEPLAEQVAISYLTKSASLSPHVMTLAAAEYAAFYPGYYKAASVMPQEKADTILGIADLIGTAVRAEVGAECGLKPLEDTIEKVASLLPELDTEEAMARFLDKLGDNEDIANEGGSEESSDTSGVEAGIVDENSPSVRKTKGPKFVSNTKSTRGFLNKIEPDIIDKILQP